MKKLHEETGVIDIKIVDRWQQMTLLMKKSLFRITYIYWLMVIDKIAFQEIIEGHPTQTGFFQTALKDRNMEVRFGLKVVLEC